jgi:hypothetical protein
VWRSMLTSLARIICMLPPHLGLGHFEYDSIGLLDAQRTYQQCTILTSCCACMPGLLTASMSLLFQHQPCLTAPAPSIAHECWPRKLLSSCVDTRASLCCALCSVCAGACGGGRGSRANSSLLCNTCGSKGAKSVSYSSSTELQMTCCYIDHLIRAKV